MQIIINISDSIYKDLQLGIGVGVVLKLEDIVVLQKGHGRLIDADKYRHLWVDTYDSSYGDECAKLFKGSVDNADTVVEADGGDA